MANPRKLILLPAILATVMLCGSAHGQGRARGTFPAAERASALMERIKTAVNDVGLSDEQRKKIDPILNDAAKNFQALVQELIPAQPPMRRQRLTAFLTDLQEKIRPILTDDQAQAFRERTGNMSQELLGPGAAPATQPAPGGQRVGIVVERLLDYVNQLDLTDEQKPEVQSIFTETRRKLAEADRRPQDQMTPMQQGPQEIVQELREQLADALTQSQLQRLRELATQGGADMPVGRRGGRAMERVMPPMDAPAQAQQAPASPAETEAQLVEVGQPAPDFTLKRIEGQTVSLASFKGRFVMVVFGSYSSPSFRQRAAALETLKRDFGTRVNFVIVYTRENHPVGEWNVERNKDDGVAVEQPGNMEGRLTLAKQARSTLKLSVPMVIDAMDDATAKAYGGSTNAAYLIGRDGSVVARQRWFEPYAMRRMLDEALKETR